MRTAPKTPKAVGYLRVSTETQATSGLGLEAQETAIRTTAAHLGLPLVALCTDAGLSGGLSLEQRPGLLAALDALTKGDVLLVAKRDRLGRDVLNVAMIGRLVERKGARVVSSAGEGTGDDDPASVLLRQIIDAFAQFERALIRRRTKAALRAKMARGELVGQPPYGYRLAADGVHLLEHPDEQGLLARLRELRMAGYTLRGIADRMNLDGERTRCGRVWRHQFVATLLARTDAQIHEARLPVK